MLSSGGILIVVDSRLGHYGDWGNVERYDGRGWGCLLRWSLGLLFVSWAK